MSDMPKKIWATLESLYSGYYRFGEVIFFGYTNPPYFTHEAYDCFLKKGTRQEFIGVIYVEEGWFKAEYRYAKFFGYQQRPVIIRQHHGKDPNWLPEERWAEILQECERALMLTYNGERGESERLKAGYPPRESRVSGRSS